MASVEIKEIKNRWKRVSEQILNICLPKNICQYFLLHTVPRSTGVCRIAGIIVSYSYF